MCPTTQLHGAEPFSISCLIADLVWNLRVHCRVHNSLPLYPILRLLNPLHIIKLISLQCILVLISRLGLPSSLFPSDFVTSNLYASPTSHIRYTYTVYLTFFHFIAPLTTGEDFILWNSMM
jgi:hypothetical protein